MSRRYPLEPVTTICRTRYRPPDDTIDKQTGDIGRTVAVLGRWTAQSVYRWQRDGLTERTADRVACELGYHPINLWPNWYEDDPT